ncbi:MAG: hypothetical protein ACRBB3_06455 [Alphaproteobacteria bacterium]
MKFADQEWPDTVRVEGFEEICQYKYYLFDWDIPVRTAVTALNNDIISEAPDYKTRGIERNNNYLALMRDGNNHDAKEISKEEFYRRCDEYMAHWTPERIKEHEERRALDLKRSEEVREEMIRLADEANAKIGMGQNDDRK